MLPCGVARLVRPAEEIFLKKRKGRAIFAARHGDDLYGHAVLLGGVARPRASVRQARESYLSAGGKIVAGEADRHVRERQQRADDAALLRGEVREAVNIKLCAAEPCAAGKLLGQHVEPPGGIGAGLRGESVERLLQKREIAQLARERGRGAFGGFAQRVGRGTAEAKLIERREELYHALGRAGSAASLTLSAPPTCSKRERGAETVGLIDVNARAAAAADGDAVGKARERKHLGIEARRIAAALRELALGLVAVLLGYDEKAAGLPPGAARRDLEKQSAVCPFRHGPKSAAAWRSLL